MVEYLTWEGKMNYFPFHLCSVCHCVVPCIAGRNDSGFCRRNLFLKWRMAHRTALSEWARLSSCLSLRYIYPAARCVITGSGVMFEVAAICLAWVNASKDAAALREMSASLERQWCLVSHVEIQPSAASHLWASLMLAGYPCTHGNPTSSSSTSCTQC